MQLSKRFQNQVMTVSKTSPTIVSLSGGKDSAAVPLAMMERGERPDYLVHVAVDWEYPETTRVVHQVAEIAGVELIVLKPAPFDWWMLERLTVTSDGKVRFGSGWPSRQHGRWCTREKFVVFDKLMATFDDPVRLVGFAADEKHRAESTEQKKRRESGQQFRYPLIEYGLTEEDALQLCYRHGINWGGLYELFRTGRRTPRLSCWCCPHQPLAALKTVRREFPHYWRRMLEMGAASPQKVFKGWVKDGTARTIEELDAIFEYEDSLIAEAVN